MPQSLIQFLNESTNNASTCQELINELLNKLHRHPPTSLNTQRSPHFSKIYQQQLTGERHNQQLQIMLHLLMSFVTLTKSPWMRSGQQTRFFQELLAPQEVHMVLHALKFELSSLGNCSHRSYFSAMTLYEALKGTGLKVAVQSSPKKDHFAVMIGNKARGWFVYDPLTNPELIFTLKEYQKEVMPLFPDVLSPKRQVKIIFSDSLITKYRNIANRVSPRILEDIQQLNPESLIRNRNIINSIVFNKIPFNEAHSLLEKACEQLKKDLLSTDALSHRSQKS